MRNTMETVHLSIDGMRCDGCAAKLSAALTSLPDTRVDAVEVGSARVSFDPQRTSEVALIRALSRLGFTARTA